MHRIINFTKNLSLFIVLGSLVFVYYYLPLNVVLLFDETGTAVEQISKSQFFYIVIAIVLLLFLLISFLNNALKSLPIKNFKLPQQDFWLADKEKQDMVQPIFQSWLFSLVIIINIFLTILSYLILLNNLDPNSNAQQRFSIVIILGIFAISTWVLFIFIRFFIKKEEIV